MFDHAWVYLNANIKNDEATRGSGVALTSLTVRERPKPEMNFSGCVGGKPDAGAAPVGINPS